MAGKTGGSCLVVIDHGSRNPESNRLVERIAEGIRELRPDCIVEHAHMESAPPTLADALANCLEAGARRVTILPHFLGPGVHTRETIPELLEELAPDYPELAIRIAEPLGPHPKLIEILLERFAAVD
jgi:sirohydrochlorin cobaltochelatase